MPTPFTQADLQTLLDAKSTDEVAQLLKDHGYEVEGTEGEASEEPEEPAFGNASPFEDRKKLAERNAKRVGFQFGDEDDGEQD